MKKKIGKDKTFKVLVLLGTAREGRLSQRVAYSVLNNLKEQDKIETIFVDVKDYAFGATIPSWVQDTKTDKWKNLVKNVDGLFIIAPEYNHSYPGELKILLDSAFDEYNKKPVAICGVSSGGFGGVRMIENLRTLVTYLGMISVPISIAVSKVEDNFSEDGESKDPKFDENVLKALEELKRYSIAFSSTNK